MHIQRSERIDYQTTVCLTSAQRGLSVTGITTNVSESGIFVTVPNPFEVGAEVICELPLPGEHLRLSGKVIWVEDQPTSQSTTDVGMGIEFGALSAADLVVLRHFVDLHQDATTRSVMVRFEGYSRPIRAKAAMTDHGLQLWTTLPFLRLSSPVDVAFEAEDYRKEGVLHQVALDIAGAVPRLQIDVAIPQNEAWESGEVIYSAPDQPSFVSGTIDVPVVQQTIVDSDPAEETLVEPIEEVAESDWTLGAPPEEPSYDRFWREAERRRQRVWLWSAALIMTGIAALSVIQTDLWQTIADRFRPAVVAKEAQAAVVPETTPTVEKHRQERPAPAQPAVAEQQAEPKHPPAEAKAAKTVKVNKALASSRGAPSPSSRLSLNTEGEGPLLRIPIGGALDDARHYQLANPDGVAINLPRGEPDLAPGHYVVNRDGFRTVWIRERQGGLQVRVFFTGHAPPHKVKLEKSSVTVQIDRQPEE